MIATRTISNPTGSTTRLADWSPIVAATLALAIAVTASGCGGSAIAQPADPTVAQDALRETLDAWRQGAKHGTGAVRVADEDWMAGRALISYRILDRDASAVVGSHLHCPVELTFRGPRGKLVKRRVVYEVSTAPAPAVLRLDTP